MKRSASSFSLKFADRDGARYLPVFGELDLSNSQALEIIVTAARESLRRLVIDLSDTDFIDSSVLGVLVRQKLKAAEQIRIVVPLEAKVRRIFEITGFDRLLDVKLSLVEAFAD